MTVSTRINYCPNPNGTYGAFPWGGGAGPISTVTVGGLSRIRMTWATGAAGFDYASVTCTGLTPGASYTFLIDNLTVNSGPAVSLFLLNSVTGVLGPSTSSITPATRATYGLTFVANSTRSMTVGITAAGATTAGQTVDFRGGLVEAGAATLPVFDGDTPGAAWSAGPGSSNSTFVNYNDAPTAAPMTIVEFDARPPGAGDFFLDKSALDGTDFLVSSPRWTPVPEWMNVAIRRGGQRDDSPIPPGTCVITLLDYSGRYDPDNPSTPLQTNGMPIMRTDMRARIGMLFNVSGVHQYVPLFVGNLEDAVVDRGWEPTVSLSFVDDLTVVNNANIQPFAVPQNAGVTTGQRAQWLMSFANRSALDIDVSATLLSPGRLMLPTSGGGNVGSALAAVANCEAGRVFAQTNGRIKVTGHTDDFVLTAAATFTDAATSSTDVEYNDIKTSSSIKSLVNQSTVDRSSGGGTNVTATDGASVALNGVRSEQPVDAPLMNDSEALFLAQYRATRRSKGVTRIDSIVTTLTGQPGTWLGVALLDIGSVIRARRTAFARTIDNIYALQGMDHNISAVSWTATYYTNPVDVFGLYPGQPQPFRLDTSSLDGPDVMISY